MPPRVKKPTGATKVTSSKAKPSSEAASNKKRAHGSDSEGDLAGPPSKKAKNGDDDVQGISVLKRGSVPVDPHSGYVDTHYVYEDHGEVWDAMLNQTNISGYTNSNKFYVIQLLQEIGESNECILFTRWGRVGEIGAKQTKGPWPLLQAVSQFKKQYRSKTGTAWEQRREATAKKGMSTEHVYLQGKYTWLERDFDNTPEDDAKLATGSGTLKAPQTPNSQLCPEIQELCKLIFSTSLLSAHLSSMNYDANKLPLGKLAKTTIIRGFAVLKELAEALGNPTSDAYAARGVHTVFADLSGQYYSIIPHDFGRQRPPIINSMALLKTELETLDSLGEMEIAQQIISASIPTDENGNAMNLLDAHFKALNLSSMSPVARESKEFTVLETYVKQTHGHTHQYKTEILNIFKVERAEEAKAFIDAGYNKLADGERMLLWHGSRSTNYAGILKQGLRIAPPEAPVSGYMFGKGIYLADMMSKSALYCHASLSGNVGLLLLCEAAVKPFYEQTEANYNADEACKAIKALATKGVGVTQPTEWQDAGAALGNPSLAGVYMPKGELQCVSPSGAYLQYNEYIVYSVTQIRLRYLLMVKLT